MIGIFDQKVGEADEAFGFRLAAKITVEGRGVDDAAFERLGRGRYYRR